MSHRPHLVSAMLIGTSLLISACSVAPPMNAQETQIKTDLAAEKFIPATRQMRDAIETQELFAQAAFWSNEYHLNPGDLESAIKLASFTSLSFLKKSSSVLPHCIRGRRDEVEFSSCPDA